MSRRYHDDEEPKGTPRVGKGHACPVCTETPGFVYGPNVAAFKPGEGLTIYDAEYVPSDALHASGPLMRPCPNRTDKRARQFYDATMC